MNWLIAKLRNPKKLIVAISVLFLLLLVGTITVRRVQVEHFLGVRLSVSVIDIRFATLYVNRCYQDVYAKVRISKEEFEDIVNKANLRPFASPLPDTPPILKGTWNVPEGREWVWWDPDTQVDEDSASGFSKDGYPIYIKYSHGYLYMLLNIITLDTGFLSC